MLTLNTVGLESVSTGSLLGTNADPTASQTGTIVLLSILQFEQFELFI